MASKGPRGNIKLVSTAGTGYFYTTTVNSRNRNMNGHQGKMVLKKYDPVAKKHVDFKEDKIK